MAVNEALIRGAATAAGPAMNFFDVFSRGFDSTYQPLIEAAKEKIKNNRADKKAEDLRMMDYLNGMEDIEIASLTPEEKMSVAKVGLTWKKEYANIAGQLSQVSASDDPELYMELSSKLNNINNKFVNLTNNFKVYKAGKLDYADSMKADEYSLINGEKIKESNDYYSGEIKINPETGDATWGGIEKPPVLIKKEAAISAGNKIKETIKKVRDLKRPLTISEKKEYANDLRAIITPEVAAMIIKDGTIPGVDSDLFYDIALMDQMNSDTGGGLGFGDSTDPENIPYIQQEVIKRLAQGISDVAEEGYYIEQQNQEDKIQDSVRKTALTEETKLQLRKKYSRRKRKKPVVVDTTIEDNAVNLVQGLVENPGDIIDLVLGPDQGRTVNGSIVILDQGEGDSVQFNLMNENQLKNFAIRLSNTQGYTVNEKLKSKQAIIKYVDSLVTQVQGANQNPDPESPENYIYLSDEELNNLD
jgi:hypothetical protein